MPEKRPGRQTGIYPITRNFVDRGVTAQVLIEKGDERNFDGGNLDHAPFFCPKSDDRGSEAANYGPMINEP